VRNFQKLEIPQLVELEKYLEFVIATEIDVSEMINKIILMRGDIFNYEDGEITEEPTVEIQYSLSEDGHFGVDKNGEPLDINELP